MNGPRILLRTVLLLLAAAGIVGLTEVFVVSGPPPPSNPRWQAEHRRRPEPNFGQFPEFPGQVALLFLFAAAGRIAFRLRLTSPPRHEAQPILLGLHRRPASPPTDTTPGSN